MEPSLRPLPSNSLPDLSQLSFAFFLQFPLVPSQVSGVPPSFSALSHSEAVTVSPAFYHSILLSLLASDSAKRLALSLLPRIAVVGRGGGGHSKGKADHPGGSQQGLWGKGGFLTRQAEHAPWHQEHRGSQDRQQDPRDPGGSKQMQR